MEDNQKEKKHKELRGFIEASLHDPHEGNYTDPDLEPSYTPDESDFEPSPLPPPSPLARKPKLSSLQTPIFFILITLFMSQNHWANPSAKEFAANFDLVYNKGEIWRLFTSLFVHVDFIHFASNAPFFLIFSFLLRDYFGFLVFPIFSFLMGTITSGITLLLYPENTYLIGISGMVFAMVGLWLTFYIRFETNHSIPMRIFRSIGFALLTLFPTIYKPSTSYLAHGIGFTLGITSALILLSVGNLIKPIDQKEVRITPP